MFSSTAGEWQQKTRPTVAWHKVLFVDELACTSTGTAFVDGSVLGFLLAAAVVVVLVNLVLRSRESCLPRLKNRGPDPFDEDGVRTLT
mmetsp:Transcript_7443/g.27330  ORF Transcript_7443/g.27330 Transcript_7443/m.27330 type:complete len:88 (+) Transcript_7443:3766-4029(+)